MTAKQYLMEINQQRRVLDSYYKQIEELRAQASGVKAISYDKDRIQTSPTNRMEEYMIKLIKTEEEYTERLYRCRVEILKRADQIAQLPNALHVAVLMQRYCEGKRWEEIAADTGYTFRHITRVHGDALQEFARIHKDVLECPKKA